MTFAMNAISIRSTSPDDDGKGRDASYRLEDESEARQTA